MGNPVATTQPSNGGTGGANQRINERQAQILKLFEDEPNTVMTIKELQARFMISPTTAKTDIIGLVNRGFLAEIAFNKVKKGYVRGDKFEDALAMI